MRRSLSSTAFLFRPLIIVVLITSMNMFRLHMDKDMLSSVLKKLIVSSAQTMFFRRFISLFLFHIFYKILN
jgi:hypothetical protein